MNAGNLCKRKSTATFGWKVRLVRDRTFNFNIFLSVVGRETLADLGAAALDHARRLTDTHHRVPPSHFPLSYSNPDGSYSRDSAQQEGDMTSRTAREMTMEEYEDWDGASDKFKAVRAAAAEEGGPTLSFVPTPSTVPFTAAPDDLCLTAVATPVGSPAIAFDPAPSRRLSGWSACRQRDYIEALAETGSVHLAAKAAGLSARGAYALRVRSAGFAAAWDAAQQLAVGRLSALAFDRAIHGRVEQVFHQGELVGEKRVPSERLLMWLLARLDPKRFAAPWERAPGDAADPQADAQAAFLGLLDALTDTLAYDPPRP